MRTLLANCAAALGWFFFLEDQSGPPSWSVVVVAALLVLPSLANVAALALVHGRVWLTTNTVILSLILADGLGFILWVPAVVLLSIVCFGAPEARNIAAVVLGFVSAVGLAAAAGALLMEAPNENAA